MSLKWHYRTYFNNYLVSIGVEDWHPFKLITLSKNPESFLKQLGSIINNGSLFQEMLFNLLPRAIVISNSVFVDYDELRKIYIGGYFGYNWFEKNIAYAKGLLGMRFDDKHQAIVVASLTNQNNIIKTVTDEDKKLDYNFLPSLRLLLESSYTENINFNAELNYKYLPIGGINFNNFNEIKSESNVETNTKVESEEEIKRKRENINEITKDNLESSLPNTNSHEGNDNPAYVPRKYFHMLNFILCADYKIDNKANIKAKLEKDNLTLRFDRKYGSGINTAFLTRVIYLCLLMLIIYVY